MQLCGGFYGKIPLRKGAQGSFEEIRSHLDSPQFDGYEAVNFIIERALQEEDGELVLCAVGKLTNVALALAREPSIARHIRVVWLGSNYPAPGEHNLKWDQKALNCRIKVPSLKGPVKASHRVMPDNRTLYEVELPSGMNAIFVVTEPGHTEVLLNGEKIRPEKGRIPLQAEKNTIEIVSLSE